MPIVHHPLAYQLGPILLTGFGLAVLMGFVIAQVICERELRRRGHDPRPIADLIFAAVLGTLVGAKLYFVLLITHRWSDLLSRNGFVFWGGFIGAVVAVLAAVRYRHYGVGRIADVAGIAVAAGYAVGRTGCWAVGDDYGRPWSGPLAVAFPNGAPPSTVQNMRGLSGVTIPPGARPYDVLAVHPTQLYETALGLVMFAILWRLRDHEHAEGWLFGVYCVLAGIERVLIEFVRAKDDRVLGPITSAQLTAFVVLAVGAVVIWTRRNVGPRAAGIHAAVPRAA